MPARFQSFAKPSNMDIDGSLFNEHVISPDLIEQLRSAMDPLRMGHKKVKQTKFRRTKFQELVMPP